MQHSSMWKGLVVMLGVSAILFLSLGCDGSAPVPARSDTNAAPGPVIVVQASYPGASATVVAETVAAPLEQQVNGLTGLLHLTSRSSDDGKYLLAATFTPGTDPNEARQRVRDRIALALPQLPEAVRQADVSIEKQTPTLQFIVLSAPTGKYDALYLGNYARRFLKGELARVPGVAAIKVFGQSDLSLRILLDSDRLTQHNLTVIDVIAALRTQKPQPATGTDPKAGPTRERLLETAQIEEIILKTDPAGSVVRLKDVSLIGAGMNGPEYGVRFNGKVCAVLGVSFTDATNPRDGSRAVAAQVDKLRASLPEGLQLEVVGDSRADQDSSKQAVMHEYLWLDVRLPDAASVERIQDMLERCARLLGEVPGVQDLLTLSENLFDLLHPQPGILVRLAPASAKDKNREEVLRSARAKFQEVQEALVRLRPLESESALAMAVCGPEMGQVRKLAEEFAKRLRQSDQATEVWVDREGAPREWLHLNIDRAKCKALGVPPDDVSLTLQPYLGTGPIPGIRDFGRIRQIVILPEARVRPAIADLQRFRVRSEHGELIPLAALATLEMRAGPAAIQRVNLKPAVIVTADRGAGVSAEQARAFCATTMAAAPGPALAGELWFDMAAVNSKRDRCCSETKK